MSSTLEDSKISIKIVIQIVIYLGSLMAVYFTMRGDIRDLQKTVDRQEVILTKYSPEVLSIQLNDVKEDLKEINGKADNILKLIPE